MMDLYLMIGIKKIDCCSMGVAEVAEKHAIIVAATICSWLY